MRNASGLFSDVFYITELIGKKITSSSREAAIPQGLMKALAGHHEALLPAR